MMFPVEREGGCPRRSTWSHVWMRIILFIFILMSCLSCYGSLTPEQYKTSLEEAEVQPYTYQMPDNHGKVATPTIHETHDRRNEQICPPDIYWRVEWRYYHSLDPPVWRWDYPVRMGPQYDQYKTRRFDYHDYQGFRITQHGDPAQADLTDQDAAYWVYLPRYQGQFQVDADVRLETNEETFHIDTGMPPRRMELLESSRIPYSPDGVYRYVRPMLIPNQPEDPNRVINFHEPTQEVDFFPENFRWTPYYGRQFNGIATRLKNEGLWPFTQADGRRPASACVRYTDAELQVLIDARIATAEAALVPAAAVAPPEAAASVDNSARNARQKAKKKRRKEAAAAAAQGQGQQAESSEDDADVEEGWQARDLANNPWKAVLQANEQPGISYLPDNWDHQETDLQILVPGDVYIPTENDQQKAFGRAAPLWLSNYNYLRDTQQWVARYGKRKKQNIDPPLVGDGLLEDGGQRIKLAGLHFPILSPSPKMVSGKKAKTFVQSWDLQNTISSKERTARHSLPETAHHGDKQGPGVLLLRPTPPVRRIQQAQQHFDGLALPVNHLKPAPYILYSWYKDHLNSPQHKADHYDYEFLALVWSWPPTLRSTWIGQPLADWPANAGPMARWTLHGLWPNLYYDKIEPAERYFGPVNCLTFPDGHAHGLGNWLEHNAQQLHARMRRIWHSAFNPGTEANDLNGFWIRQWKKHGTCGHWSSPWLGDHTAKEETDDAKRTEDRMKEYFRVTVSLTERYPIRMQEIVATPPNQPGAGYTAAEIKTAIAPKLNLKEEDEQRSRNDRHGPVALICHVKHGRVLLAEVMICLHPVTLLPVHCLNKDSDACYGGQQGAAAGGQPPRIFIHNNILE